jgi:RNA polymerase sporulation-specific sigma factor
MFLFELIRNLFCFTGSYSIDSFLEPLSLEDETKYIELKMLGDKDARNKLIEHNLRLVAHIVKKYDTKFVSNDDLISIGTIGLIKGIDTFSNVKGVKLTTYCARCIENEVLMFFRANNKYCKDVSINETIGYDKEGNEISLIDILKTTSIDYIEEIDTKDKIFLLKKYLDVLNDNERFIIINRYGLGCDEKTQKVIAKELGISRSYVSRIEKRALTKILREFINSNNL